ncbi:MAG: glycosyltransferase family 2 protein [Kiritimatiellia bacterium]
MTVPLVSVIVGVYNKKAHVGECLDSVFGQTYRNFELIVVDDCSTDGSPDVIRGFRDSRINFIQRNVNSSLPAVPRNQAMKMAHGKYLAFLDADDVWMPDKLEEQISYMETRPAFPFTHTRCMVVDGGGRDLYLRSHGNYPPDGDCFVELLKKCFICTSTVMLRKELADVVGYFSEEQELRCGEDHEYFLRCARRVHIGMPEGVLAKYRWCPDSTFHHPDNWRATTAGLLLNHPYLWKDRITPSEIRDILYGIMGENVYYWRTRLDFRKASWFAGQMIRFRPCSLEGWRQLAASGLRRK